MQKGFIFDLDGVIVDTAKYHFQCWQAIAAKAGVQFTLEENEELKGVGRVQSLEWILKKSKKSFSQKQRNIWLEEKNQHYVSLISHMTRKELLPGVLTVMEKIRDTGHRMALGSASKNAKLILNILRLTSSFDVIVDGKSVESTKPSPEGFLLAAELMRIPPENCVVFEDAIAGVQAANSAGMLSIGIGQQKYLHEAKYCFESFADMDSTFLNDLTLVTDQ